MLHVAYFISFSKTLSFFFLGVILCFVRSLYDVSDHVPLCSAGLQVKHFPLLHPTPKYFASSHYKVKLFDNTQSHHVNEKNFAWALKFYHPQTLYHPQTCCYNLLLFPLFFFPLLVCAKTISPPWEGLPTSLSVLQSSPLGCPHWMIVGKCYAPAQLLSMGSKAHRAWLRSKPRLSGSQPKTELGPDRYIHLSWQLGSAPGSTASR